ncbi:MAG: DUF4389 domain-containing protein [Alphaproteobacteria bacterium]|nr:DUF4389 domain-containing protein [Alphaproteobacteria bacterium]
MTDDLSRNLTQASTWLRLLFMILYGIVLYVALYVLAIVTIVQFLCKLFTGQVFARLMALGQSIGLFLYQIAAYLTFRTDRRPFPFAPWPAGTVEARNRRSDRPGAPPAPAAAPREERRGGMRVVRPPGRRTQDPNDGPGTKA